MWTFRTTLYCYHSHLAMRTQTDRLHWLENVLQDHYFPRGVKISLWAVFLRHCIAFTVSSPCHLSEICEPFSRSKMYKRNIYRFDTHSTISYSKCSQINTYSSNYGTALLFSRTRCLLFIARCWLNFLVSFNLCCFVSRTLGRRQEPCKGFCDTFRSTCRNAFTTDVLQIGTSLASALCMRCEQGCPTQRLWTFFKAPTSITRVPAKNVSAPPKS